MKRFWLVLCLPLVLAACGGGGGGGGMSATMSPYVRTSVPFYTPTSGGSFQTYTSGSTAPVVQDIYTRDLNRDNVDEVVVAGRMSQPATAATWNDYNMQVYGWNTGSFSRETGSWFAGVNNVIKGTEPAVRFGDFNGDGHVDMFVAPSTDGALTNTPGSVFMNSGRSSFASRQDLNFGNVWSHDAAVSDMNGDGIADIVITDYNGRPAIAFGSNTGAFTIAQATGATGASGISIADYLSNGTKTIVLTDAAATGNKDTKLYSWNVAGGALVLTEQAVLPASRFYLPKWDSQRAAVGVAPHEIRNISMDFNRDGRPDVIVFSTLPSRPGESHGYGEVQFLRNDGGGNFTDVTDSVLFNFNTTISQSYQPTLIDVNKDGLLDIVMSSADYTSTHNSHRILLQSSDGKFTEAFGSVLKDFYKQTQSMTAGANAANQQINIATGPNGDLYLITAIAYNANGTGRTAMYAAKIGSNGTTSAQATLDAINTVWPYLTSIEANDALAKTATNFINGIPVIDWQAVMSPVGALGIPLDGRTGQRRMLQGLINVPGLNLNLLNNIQAVDDIGRNFRVNLSGMSRSLNLMPIQYTEADTQDVSRNWSSRFVDDNFRDVKGVTFSGVDSARFSTSVSNRHFGSTNPTTYRVGITRIPGSPWFGFTGVFGNVLSSTILDMTATRTWKTNTFLQAGMMQTTTQIQNGLVQSVAPLWAGYAVGGYQDQHWSLYTGLQPTIFSGYLDMKLPTSVDRDGTMRYTNTRIQIRNQPIGFAGMERRWQEKVHTWKLGGVVNMRSQYQIKLSYQYDFK